MRMLPLGLVLLLVACTAGDKAEVTGDTATTTIPPVATETGDTAAIWTNEWTIPELPYDCYAVVGDDWYGDGLVDGMWIEVYEPWPQNVLIEQHYGDSLDDPVIYRESRVYDPDGQVIEYGLWDYTYGAVTEYNWYTRDGNGNVVLTEMDIDDDMLPDLEIDYLYDGNDDLTEIAIDIEMDGVVDERQTVSYVEPGRRDRIDVDLLDDGSVDDAWTYEWLDPYAEQYILRFDVGVDDVIDEWYEIHLDEDGNYTYYAADEDADGDLEIEYAWTWAGDGNPITIEGTVWEGGSWQYDFAYHYTYLADGKTEARTLTADFTGNGNPDYTQMNTWYWECP